VCEISYNLENLNHSSLRESSRYCEIFRISLTYFKIVRISECEISNFYTDPKLSYYLFSNALSNNLKIHKSST